MMKAPPLSTRYWIRSSYRKAEEMIKLSGHHPHHVHDRSQAARGHWLDQDLALSVLRLAPISVSGFISGLDAAGGEH